MTKYERYYYRSRMFLFMHNAHWARKRKLKEVQRYFITKALACRVLS